MHLRGMVLADLIRTVSQTMFEFRCAAEMRRSWVTPRLFGHFKAERDGRVLVINAINNQLSCRETVELLLDS